MTTDRSIPPLRLPSCPRCGKQFSGGGTCPYCRVALVRPDDPDEPRNDRCPHCDGVVGRSALDERHAPGCPRKGEYDARR